MSETPAILIMGATASGKSGLAMRLAKQFDGELISVDSAQIYRQMDIGTAKPTEAEQLQVRHHLIDILDPTETYSAAQFADDAVAAINDIRARGKTPVLVGGTHLYFRALTQGFSELPPSDAELRAQLDSEAESVGWAQMHQKLTLLDAETAQRLHPNDHQRIQRALEICILTGKAASEFFNDGRKPIDFGRFVKIAVMRDERAELHKRIEARFLQMIQQGFVEEVRALFERGDLSAQLPSMRAVGYRQFWKHLQGEWSQDEAVQRGIFATRQYAKRQLTWLRSEAELNVVNPDDENSVQRVLSTVFAC